MLIKSNQLLNLNVKSPVSSTRVGRIKRLNPHLTRMQGLQMNSLNNIQSNVPQGLNTICFVPGESDILYCELWELA